MTSPSSRVIITVAERGVLPPATAPPCITRMLNINKQGFEVWRHRDTCDFTSLRTDKNRLMLSLLAGIPTRVCCPTDVV